jgi:hypothetical protein
MRFLSRPEVRKWFDGKSVAIVGSGPGVLDNAPDFVDSHDVVVRVNNYKLTAETGRRTDCFYSFFGGSIKKKAEELKRDGVTLCMCKCPDDQPIESKWHRENGKMAGCDFRWIYKARKDFWFCDTYIPTTPEFMSWFNMLGGHVPSTGFSAILDVLSFDPKSVYLTGFDFFRSGLHNVNEPHQKKNPLDPIGHVPEQEIKWLRGNLLRYPIATDQRLTKILAAKGKA